MKSLKESINENLNESVLGIAGGIIAGLIGFKLIKSIITSFAKAGINNILSSKLKEGAETLENVLIPRLEELLQAHPESYKWINKMWNKNNVKDTLTRVRHTLGSITFADDCISKDDWSAEDAEEFRTLWKRAFDINDVLRTQMEQELSSALK